MDSGCSFQAGVRSTGNNSVVRYCKWSIDVITAFPVSDLRLKLSQLKPALAAWWSMQVVVGRFPMDNISVNTSLSFFFFFFNTNSQCLQNCSWPFPLIAFYRKHRSSPFHFCLLYFDKPILNSHQVACHLLRGQLLCSLMTEVISHHNASYPTFVKAHVAKRQNECRYISIGDLPTPYLGQA